MKNWWNKQTGAAKAFYAVVAAVLILGLLGAVVNAFRGGAGGQADKQITTDLNEITAPKSDTPFTDTDQDEPEEAAPGEGDEEVSLGDFTFTIDDTGMVEMPVTTDPREAAAGAAAVAFTVDFEQWEHEGFLKEVIMRMTHPTEDYKGPEGEIHTMWYDKMDWSDPGFAYEYRKPEEALWMMADKASAFNTESYQLYWWMILSKQTIFEAQKMIPGQKWVGTPIELYDEEQMKELYPAAVREWNEKLDQTPDTPGATVTQWWGQVEVPQAGAETAQPQTKFPFMMGVWCDAPEDGGVCGVAYAFTSATPQGWASADIR